MKRKLLITVVVLISFFGGTSTAKAHSTVLDQAKVRYYHADGIVKWIGNHAKMTQYNPNPRKKNHWQSAVKFWRGVRHDAWQTLHPQPARPTISNWLIKAFTCIHHYEGSWTSNTGNGYYGGLQMDYTFQSTYGPEFLDQWGTADNWPVWAQLAAAVRAYQSGRGFSPWPNTARFCGLL